MNIPSTALQELLFNKIEDFPKWNPTVKEAKIVQVSKRRNEIFVLANSSRCPKVLHSRFPNLYFFFVFVF